MKSENNLKNRVTFCRQGRDEPGLYRQLCRTAVRDRKDAQVKRVHAPGVSWECCSESRGKPVDVRSTRRLRGWEKWIQICL